MTKHMVDKVLIANISPNEEVVLECEKIKRVIAAPDIFIKPCKALPVPEILE